MLRTVRLWIADFIAPNDFTSRMLLCSRCADYLFRGVRENMIEWHTSNGLHMLAIMDKGGDLLTTHSIPQKTTQTRPQLECNICTNVFSLDHGSPYQCPSCGSKDLSSTGKMV